MQTIYPLTGNYVNLFLDDLPAVYPMYQITFTKPEIYNMVKTLSIINFSYVDYEHNGNEFGEKYILELFFCEVDQIDETLIGNVNLHIYPGEWIMVIEGKEITDLEWNFLYTDLSRCLPLSDNITVYSN